MTQLNEIKRMQKLAGLISESQLNEVNAETMYFKMDGTKTKELENAFTFKSTYDPGMIMISPKDLNDKSDRADGILGYIFSFDGLKDKSLYPLGEKHPDYKKLIVMSQSTKEDLSNLIKKLGGTQIDPNSKSEPAAESLDQTIDEALKAHRNQK